MTLQEARNTKPLRIKIVTVSPTDTINTLAARMDVGDKKRERFLVLNGLQPGETLTPGSQLKIIVE
jgi:predicted Zn-dependent protease